MKPFLLLLILLIFSNGFAQTYQFNLLTDYVTSGTALKGFYQYHNITYSNTENNDYYLVINIEGDARSAYLQDHKNNKRHYLKCTENIASSETFYAFEYINSSTGKVLKPRPAYLISPISRDSTTQVFRISVYEDERKKRDGKPEREQEITVDTSGKDSFGLYENLFTFGQVNYLPVTAPEKNKGLVKSAVWRGAQPWSRRLVQSKSVDFKIDIYNPIFPKQNRQ